MLRNILLPIFLLSILFTLSTCKKYPEDKFISFTTVKCRLEGEWQLERIEINDENIGYKYNDSLAPLTFKDYKFWFKFSWQLDKNNKETFNLFMINKSSKSEKNAIEEVDVSRNGFSIFPKKEKNLTIAPGNRPLVIDSVSSKILITLLTDFFWQIRILHNKQLVIEKNKNNLKYRLSFKKIRNK